MGQYASKMTENTCLGTPSGPRTRLGKIIFVALFDPQVTSAHPALAHVRGALVPMPPNTPCPPPPPPPHPFFARFNHSRDLPPKELCAIVHVHTRHSAQSVERKLARQWPVRPLVPFSLETERCEVPICNELSLK